MNPSAPERPGRTEHTPKPPVSLEEPKHPRRKTLVAHCKTCHKPFAFEADQMNAGGMFQIDKGADKCPSCHTEAEEVYTLQSEPLRLEAAEDAGAIAPPADRQAGKVYRRAALSRNTAGMGMDPVPES